MSWVVAAFASALFAGITSILAKCGIKQTDSDVATAIRTCVVLVFAWAMAGISGSIGTIGSIEPRSWLFLVLSGLATGASWICYFKALGIGDVNKVVPVDKMSTVLAALIAIVLFGETSNLAVKLVGTAVITLGTFLMIEKKQPAGPEQQQDRTWLAYALGAAVFAALTSILAKAGIEGVESNLATAIRTCVVLVMAWAIVAAKGKMGQAVRVDRYELVFLAASGIATGASWLLCYYAIATGQVASWCRSTNYRLSYRYYLRTWHSTKNSHGAAPSVSPSSYWAPPRSQFGSSAASSRYILTPGLGCLY